MGGVASIESGASAFEDELAVKEVPFLTLPLETVSSSRIRNDGIHLKGYLQVLLFLYSYTE
jgi:hypothetical protein